MRRCAWCYDATPNGRAGERHYGITPALAAGRAVQVRVDAAVTLSPNQPHQILAVDLALRRLTKIDERKSRVLEMRFFGGLDIEETAEALGVSPNTAFGTGTSPALGCAASWAEIRACERRR